MEDYAFARTSSSAGAQMINDVAVVTGAGSGIGHSIALRLAVDHVVVAVDINSENLTKVVQEIVLQGGQAHSIVGDVADRATHIQAREVAATKSTLGARVDSAGWTRGAALHDFPT